MTWCEKRDFGVENKNIYLKQLFSAPIPSTTSDYGSIFQI